MLLYPKDTDTEVVRHTLVLSTVYCGNRIITNSTLKHNDVSYSAYPSLVPRFKHRLKTKVGMRHRHETKVGIDMSIGT